MVAKEDRTKQEMVVMNEYPDNYPRHGFHICHGCGSMAPHHTQKDLPDNGWIFDINNFGYYGGFTDTFGDPPQLVRMCHDCVNKFLETFPLLGMFVQNGNHSQFGPNEKPCCKYAWKLESIENSSITWIATEDGQSWQMA